MLLRRDGQPDEIIAAGLLHDILEKTATTSAELQRLFGRRSRGSSNRSQTTRRSAITSPANATYATACAHATPARARSSRRTRSPKSASWRCCQRGSWTNPRTTPSSPITAPASTRSGELTGTYPSSIGSTPSSTNSWRARSAGTRAPDRSRAPRLEAQQASNSGNLKMSVRARGGSWRTVARPPRRTPSVRRAGMQLRRDQSQACPGPGSRTRRKALRFSDFRAADEPIAVT